MATNAKQKQYDETNRGALFKNHDKKSDRDPDYSGSINTKGQDFWLSAWINTSKTGSKYMSLAVRSKDQPNDRAPRKDDKPDAAAEAFGIE
jgi:hypothetical protein